MKGINTLNLNYETVMDAVTEYLAKRMVTPPVVRGIGAMGCSGWSAHITTDATTGRIQAPTSGTLEVRLQDPVEFLQGPKP